MLYYINKWWVKYPKLYIHYRHKIHQIYFRDKKKVIGVKYLRIFKNYKNKLSITHSNNYEILLKF